ncbi:MAG: hypothetical protein M1839_003508 [Geoglossum umbratile]|nr:MAG: hypothetical protein M1839_003508 [Geoglossum umbratile]
MAQNCTSPCLFTTREDVFQAMQKAGSGAEGIANLCPNVCTLAYGNGNPDLSGQGMMSCYVLDVALSLLCGPAYSIALWYYRRRNANFTDKLEVQRLFFEAQGLFTVPVLVASVVRIEQSPPMFEIAFLQRLNLTVAFSLYATFWSLCYLASDHKWSIVIYTCSVVALQMTIFARSGSQKAIPTEARQLIDYCTKYSGTEPQYAGQDWKLQVGIGCATIGFGVAIPAISYIYYNFQPGEKTIEWRPVFQMYSICCAGMALFSATQLFAVRESMKSATGSAFTDDQWGFGQVAAVFMWIGWAIQITERTYGTLDSALYTPFRGLKP